MDLSQVKLWCIRGGIGHAVVERHDCIYVDPIAYCGCGKSFTVRPDEFTESMPSRICSKCRHHVRECLTDIWPAFKRPKPAIRWMIRMDMPGVLAIDQASFAAPWTDDDYLKTLRQRNAIGMVAEYNGRVAGSMIYELHKSKLVALRMAVDPKLHRQGIGSAMIEKLKSKLSSHRRTRLVFYVPEFLLGMQLFLKSQGFHAVSVKRAADTGYDDDLYVMQYAVREGATALCHD